MGIRSAMLSRAVLGCAALFSACGGGGGGGGDSDTTAALVLLGSIPRMDHVMVDEAILPAYIPLDEATVIAEVGPRTYAGTYANGAFEVAIGRLDPSDFVRVRLRGTGARSDVELGSLLGTGALLAASAGSDHRLTAAEFPRLSVSGASTALWGLVENLDPEYTMPDAPTDADLDRAERHVDTDRVNDLGAAVELVANDESLELPEGAATTLELVRDAQAGREFRIALITEHNGAFHERIVVMTRRVLPLAALTSGGYPKRFALPMEYPLLGITVEMASAASGRILALQYGGGDSQNLVSDVAFGVEGSTLTITPVNQDFVFFGWSQKACPDTGQFQQDAAHSLQQVRVTLWGGSAAQPLVGVESDWNENYHYAVGLGGAPSNCAVENADYTLHSSGALRVLDGPAWTESMLVGTTWLLPVYEPAAGTLAGSFTVGGDDDRWTFSADHTGTLERASAAFAWQIDAQGQLVVQLDDERQFAFRRSPFGRSNHVFAATATVRWYGDELAATAAFTIEPDPAFIFEASTMPGHYGWWDIGLPGEIRDFGYTFESCCTGAEWGMGWDAYSAPGQFTTPFKWSIDAGSVVLDIETNHADGSADACDPELDVECFVWRRSVLTPIRRVGDQVYMWTQAYYGIDAETGEYVPAEQVEPYQYVASRGFRPL